ncbi:MAG TPA: DUF3037 domain-containing protein [Yinghuangia sp.]|uniref:DUF3037 domain-containing protein n=1 Tax=Yinghuangia sp. YIM S10712 TaxID=3436930 RepID=UPI002B552CAA|nr:DUF3037 domain-containing protein [Yinghuangia sp.]
MPADDPLTAEVPPRHREFFEYALIRVMPRVDRGECINAGVVLYSQAFAFLGARTHLDVPRLRALDPRADTVQTRAALSAWEMVCAGAPGAGPAGGEPLGRRFRWLTAPRSAVVQPGPVHGGLTANPAAELDRLFDLLVL